MNWHLELGGTGGAPLHPLFYHASGSTMGLIKVAGAFTCRTAAVRDLTWSFAVDVRVEVTATLADEVPVHREIVLEAYAQKRNLYTCLDEVRPDPIADWINSVQEQVATLTEAVFDLIGSFATVSSITQDEADALKNNSVYECGEADDQGRLTVCADDGETLEAGDLLTVTMTLADDVPTGDTEHSYIYALVIDSDGDPANDWIAQLPFDWDLFQGADRWYQLIWDHTAQAWSLTVTQVQPDQTMTQVASGAWVVIDGPHLNMFVPGAEFDRDAVRYRVTAFGHDGAFSEDERGADVSGADPTEPLRPIDLDVDG